MNFCPHLTNLPEFLAKKPDVKILIVRNDGLGDLILTYPLEFAIRKRLPRAQITFLVREPFAEITSMVCHCKTIVDEGVLLKRDKNKFTPRERRNKQAELVKTIKNENFDIALIPYAEKDTAAVIYKSGVKYRVGSMRRSFFWRFTHFFKHSRKSSPKSEFEMNLAYAKILGLQDSVDFTEFTDMARASLLGKTAPKGEPETGMAKNAAHIRLKVVIHPYKRSGTSLVWPMENFALLAARLSGSKTKIDISIIGDKADEEVLKAHFEQIPGVKIEVDRNLLQLGQFLSSCDLYIGNSSGPLHYAALLGIPHIGFFPRANTLSSVRWKTFYRKDSNGHIIDQDNYMLEPPVVCNKRLCAGENCQYFNCLEKLSVDEALEAVNFWLGPVV